MVDQILLNYIKSCLAEGYKVDQIYNELIENGYRDDEITFSLRYLKINDPSIDQHNSLKEDSTFKRREEEIQRRNLANLIRTGYSPEQIEKDLTTSGMEPHKALETVSTLISPFKDKLEFIGYHIQSLKKEGFSNKQIEFSFRRQNIPEQIIRNISDSDKIKEIVDNIDREKEMSTYHLGILQRIFATLYNPILNYWIGKIDDKFFYPLLELLRIQITIFIAGVVINVAAIFVNTKFDLANVKWEQTISELIIVFSLYIFAFAYQLAAVVVLSGFLKTIAFLSQEKLSLQECLKIISYSYIPSFIFYIVVLSISWTTLPKLYIFIGIFVITALLRINPTRVGINYFLHTKNLKLYMLTITTNLGLIAFELLLGYWTLIENNYVL
ncbi:YIP1 family protein [Candidatus Dojkabacteria bacterium]|nr:YIP1 family protein [Candidatus Dojkabacteria bacterium]